VTSLRRGLFVGRFQPFHLGHLHAIKEALKKVDELVIVVGSAQYSHELENPFTAGERVAMIRAALEEAGIPCSRYLIIPVQDAPYHMVWVPQVVGFTPPFDVVFSNEPLTRRLFIEANYKVEGIPFYKRKLCNATEIRRLMIEDGEWEGSLPPSVCKIIKEIDGVKRLKDLTKTDKPRS